MCKAPARNGFIFFVHFFFCHKNIQTFVELRKKMDWLRGPLPVAALRDLIDTYVPKFQNRPLALRRTLRPICSVVALSHKTVVWCEDGGNLFGWDIIADKHWFVGQVSDSHIECLVGLSGTQFVVMTPRRTLHEWDVSLGRHRFVEEIDGSPRFLALLSNAELAISYCDGSIGVWNRSEHTHRNLVPSPTTWCMFWRKSPISHRDQWTCLLPLPDCKLAAGSCHGVVCVFDATSGACLQTCHQKQSISFMSWRPTTESLLISTLWGAAEWGLSQVKTHSKTQVKTQAKATPHKGPGHLVPLEDGSVVLFDLSRNEIGGFANLGDCRFVVAFKRGIVVME